MYRKIAYRTLFDRWKQTRNDDKVKYCLDVFRSRVVFEVDNTLSSVEKRKTKTKGKKGSERLEIMVSRHEALLKDNKEAKSVVKKIIALRVGERVKMRRTVQQRRRNVPSRVNKFKNKSKNKSKSKSRNKSKSKSRSKSRSRIRTWC